MMSANWTSLGQFDDPLTITSIKRAVEEPDWTYNITNFAFNPTTEPEDTSEWTLTRLRGGTCAPGAGAANPFVHPSDKVETVEKCSDVMKMFGKNKRSLALAQEYCDLFTTSCMSEDRKGKTKCVKAKCSKLKTAELCELKDSCEGVYRSRKG